MAAPGPRPILLPDPPLSDGVVALRAWRREDAPALVAAWADPEVRRWTAVPPRTDLAHAHRWIADSAERRRRRLALDLVIGPAGGASLVLGEVGLAWTLGDAQRAALGWWVAPGERGRGTASRAVRLLADWALDRLGLAEVVADVDPANAASTTVARRAGLVHLGKGRWSASRGGTVSA